MSKPKIGIIISTTRANRFADKPTAWIKAIADARGDLDTEVIDLRDYPLPFFDELGGPAYVPVTNPVAQLWQAKLDEMDGFIIVAAEYNRAPTGVLKNAIDYAYTQFVRKPVAFVGYGGVGAARAIEQLRLIAIEVQMAPTRTAVHIAGGDFMGVWQQGKSLSDLPHLEQAAHAMLDELTWWTVTLKAGREASARKLAA